MVMELLRSVGGLSTDGSSCKYTLLGYLTHMFNGVPFNWANIMRHMYDTIDKVRGVPAFAWSYVGQPRAFVVLPCACDVVVSFIGTVQFARPKICVVVSHTKHIMCRRVTHVQRLRVLILPKLPR